MPPADFWEAAQLIAHHDMLSSDWIASGWSARLVDAAFPAPSTRQSTLSSASTCSASRDAGETGAVERDRLQGTQRIDIISPTYLEETVQDVMLLRAEVRCRADQTHEPADVLRVLVFEKESSRQSFEWTVPLASS
eukprot:3093583-Rhodomonas_salina.3